MLSKLHKKVRRERECTEFEIGDYFQTKTNVKRVMNDVWTELQTIETDD